MTVPFSTARNIDVKIDETITNNAAGGANVVQLSDGATNFITSFAGLSVDPGNGDLLCGSGLVAQSRDVIALGGKVEAQTTIPTQPAAPDVPNYPTDATGDFKMRIDTGFNLALAPAVPPFDAQELLNNALGFPVGSVLDFTNNLPTKVPRILGRIASGVTIVPGNNYVLNSFGSTTAFQDRLISDPCNMRSRKIGSTWIYAGCPAVLRTAGTLGDMLVNVFLDANWQGVADPGNKCTIYCHQYRNAVLLRSYLMGQNRSQDGECIINCRRTFLGHTGSFGEDIDVLTDDFQVELINQSTSLTSDLVVNLGQVEMEFQVAM